MENLHLFEIIIGGVSVAINALAGFGLWMIRGRLRDKDSVIMDLRAERKELRDQLEECHEHKHKEGHNG